MTIDPPLEPYGGTALLRGELARHQTSLDLTAGGGDASAAHQPRRPARQVVLHVHLAATLTGEHGSEFDRLATLEHGHLQVVLDQVKTWCTAAQSEVSVGPTRTTSPACAPSTTASRHTAVGATP